MPEPRDRLIIDRSPALPVDDAELRAWAATQTVFVSSVMRDMDAERSAVADAVERAGASPVLFERLGGRDDGPQQAYLDGVRGSDIYLGILGERYGIPDETGYSPTHREYDQAVHAGLRISVWNSNGALDGRQRDFLDEVRVFHTTGDYSSPAELATKVDRRMREFAAQHSSPWCKVGRSLFRTARFHDSGSRLRIEASIRDDEVVAELESLRPHRWGSTGPQAITCRGRSYAASVQSVEVEVAAGRAKRIVVEATPQEASGSGVPSFSYQGHSPDELTEMALRGALLGEENPLGTMAFAAEVPDPFGGIRGMALSEEVVPGVADVLMVEALVGSGRAERVASFRLGPHHLGHRRILVEWLPVRRHGAEPQLRRIEGRLQL